MLLKVGELARRAGLTVRTLHHYDSIGLLVASVRSDAGYRLYNRDDIARLHQIQALRRLGLPLADIGDILARPDVSLAGVIDQQIHMLEHQLAQTARLRDRLLRLRAQHASGAAPDLADWLQTLELMTMYDKYFTDHELRTLPYFAPDSGVQQRWAALAREAAAALAAGMAPADERAQDLARRWMLQLEHDTASNPELAARLDHMFSSEPALQQDQGVTPAMIDFIVAAFAETKMRLYEKYLAADEIAHLRANYGKRVKEWMPLVAQVHRAIANGDAPEAPASRALARRWLELFRSYAGDNPATHEKFRHAMAQEPELLAGTWVTPDTLAFLRQAMTPL